MLFCVPLSAEIFFYLWQMTKHFRFSFQKWRMSREFLLFIHQKLAWESYVLGTPSGSLFEILGKYWANHRRSLGSSLNSMLSFCLVMYMCSICRLLCPWNNNYKPQEIKLLLQCMKNNCQEGCNVKLTFWFCLLYVTLQGNNCQLSFHYTGDLPLQQNKRSFNWKSRSCNHV